MIYPGDVLRYDPGPRVGATWFVDTVKGKLELVLGQLTQGVLARMSFYGTNIVPAGSLATVVASRALETHVMLGGRRWTYTASRLDFEAHGWTKVQTSRPGQKMGAVQRPGGGGKFGP